MSGFYVHIPFCARRCPYCDFAIHIGAKADFRAAYLDALQREISASESETVINSIFFGGGTPTELGSAELSDLLQLIFDNFNIAPDAEISIEANPENLTKEKLQALRVAGFNRLSLGAQSFDQSALQMLGRRHAPSEIEAVIERARGLNWPQISIDLIYAVPGQSRADWQNTLHRALQLKLEHISCYALTIESGTPFARRVAQGRLLPLEDDAQAEFMRDAMDILSEAGLERYEVSNYARPGYESRHNLNYWRGGDYLAVGCGAHGHYKGHRFWNERSAPLYVKKMQGGTARAGEEFLTVEERFDEIVALGLRLREGINLENATRLLDFDVRGALQSSNAWPFLLEEGILQQQQSENSTILRLNSKFWPVADAVAARLLT